MVCVCVCVYIYTHTHTTVLPLSCTDGRYFYYISGTALFSGTNYGLFRFNIYIFITFEVHQVQLKKVPLNGKKWIYIYIYIYYLIDDIYKNKK